MIAHFCEYVGLGLHCQTKEKAGAFKLQVCGIQNSAKTWNFFETFYFKGDNYGIFFKIARQSLIGG